MMLHISRASRIGLFRECCCLFPPFSIPRTIDNPSPPTRHHPLRSGFRPGVEHCVCGPGEDWRTPEVVSFSLIQQSSRVGLSFSLFPFFIFKRFLFFSRCCIFCVWNYTSARQRTRLAAKKKGRLSRPSTLSRQLPQIKTQLTSAL